MNALITTSSEAKQPLSFWDLRNFRADSVVGKVLLLGLGGYVVLHLDQITAFISRVVWNTITIGIGVGILAALFLLLQDGRILKVIDYGIQAIIRAIVGQFVAISPIDVMKSRLDELRKKIATVVEELKRLRSARQSAHDTLEKYREELSGYESEIEQATKHPDQDPDAQRAFIAQQASAAERRINSIELFEQLVARMDAGLRILEKLKMKATYVYDDIEDNVTFTEHNRKALKAATSAIRNIRVILFGGDRGGELYNMAVEAANQQAADMLGEIDQFMEDSRSIMRSFELQEYGAVDKALERLEQRGNARVLEYQPGAAKVELLSHNPGTPVQTMVPMPDTTGKETADDIRTFLNS